jgi:organic radical activating enzyme
MMAISNLHRIRLNDPGTLLLTWILNNICTNKCAYCPSILHEGTNHNYEWHHAKEFAENLISKYPKIQLAISGGEPTLSPWFEDLVKMFSDKGHPVGITTNGARTIQFFEKISPYLTYIVMSYHPSYHDDNFVKKVIACSKRTPTSVSIIMDSRYFDQALEMYHTIVDLADVEVELKIVNDWIRESTVGRDYTAEQLEKIKSIPHKIISNKIKPKNKLLMKSTAYYDSGESTAVDAQRIINEGKDNFFGWSCNIGLESLFVNFDGKIKKANCASAEYLGDIQHLDDVQWPSKPVICPQTYCDCATDIYVSKQLLK